MTTFNEALAAQYTKQIMTALMYMHGMNIIHRDLKPENLMLVSNEPDSILKIIDFGISVRFLPGEMITDIAGTVKYMAPEIFSNEYDCKCDIWSVGVILYLMLSGNPPFTGNRSAILIEKIKNSPLDFEGEIWNSVSNQAKNLLTKMLEKNPERRYTADDVLASDWIVEMTENPESSVAFTNEVLSNLSNFTAETKLEKSIYLFITSNILSSKEEMELLRVFKDLDSNNDGHISIEELRSGYLGLNFSDQINVDAILEKCDLDKNGEISYSEFVTAAFNAEMLDGRKELLKAFKTYDRGGDGQLSIAELKKAIPGIVDTEWDAFFQHADANADGLISFEEFKHYLERSDSKG